MWLKNMRASTKICKLYLVYLEDIYVCHAESRLPHSEGYRIGGTHPHDVRGHAYH